MPDLGSRPTLSDIQRYVVDLENERGFANETLTQKCLLLGEETGELFKAVRKHVGMCVDSKSSISGPAEEIADVLILLCAVANRLGIDVETAFRDKEEINKQRKWVSS